MIKGDSRSMIVGSSGKPDYLLVGRCKGILVGVKPLVYLDPNVFVFGVRVRFVHEHPSKRAEVADMLLQHGRVYFKQRVNHLRVSYRHAVVVPLALVLTYAGTLEGFIREYYLVRKVLKPVYRDLTEYTHPKADVITFVTGGWLAGFSGNLSSLEEEINYKFI